MANKNEYGQFPSLAFPTISSERVLIRMQASDAVRPEWTDTLAIKQGRHPLHEQFRMSDGSFVPK